MKFFRHGERNQERPGVLIGDVHYDLGDHAADFSRGGVSIEALSALRDINPATLTPLEPGFRFGAVIADPRNYYCIGMLGII